MSLRIRIRREIKQALEEEGFSQEEIQDQLTDLTEEEFNRQERDKERERQEREKERQERDKEREEAERQRQYELELKRIESQSEASQDNLSREKITKYDKISPYDESEDLEGWLNCFEERTSEWPEQRKVLELRNAFLKSKVSKEINNPLGRTYEELKQVILHYYNITTEEYRLRFRNGKFDEKRQVHSFIVELKTNLSKWMEQSDVHDFEDLINLLIKEQFYNSVDKGIQNKLREIAFFEKDIKEITKYIQNYVNGRKENSYKNIVSEKPVIKCYNCNKFGHISSDCRSKPIQSKRSFTNWRKETEKCNYAIAEKDDDNSVFKKSEDGVTENTEDKCFLTFKEEKENFNLTLAKGTINGKEASILRDSGCTTVIVHNKFISNDSYTGEYGILKVADGKEYKVPKVNIMINSPYFSGNVTALCFNTNIDLIIGNIPGVKCLCKTSEIVKDDILPINDKTESLKKIMDSRSKNPEEKTKFTTFKALRKKIRKDLTREGYCGDDFQLKLEKIYTKEKLMILEENQNLEENMQLKDEKRRKIEE